MKRIRFVPIVAVAIAIVSPALAWGPADQYGTFGPDDDTIYDMYTGLTWQRASTAATLTQADATATCAALTLEGQTWRLPTMKELLSLVEDTPHTVYQNGMDVSLDVDSNAFFDTASACFWTSSFAGTTSSAFEVSMADGQTTLGDPTSPCAARCVER
jgi:Protein of unknown function (DUF1566)